MSIKSIGKSFISFFKQHIICICCSLVGLIAGLWGIIAGFLLGFFIEKIIERYKEDCQLKQNIENPVLMKESFGGEPFDGAVFVCALAVYATGNPIVAAKHMNKYFYEYVDADFLTLCRAAFEAESINGDLLTECLAAKVKKNPDKARINQIFGLLNSVEYGWNEKRGNPPSVYLAELLNVKLEKSYANEAYTILGLTETASLRAIKAAHRKLAAIYHPDTLKGFSNEQKEIATEAFYRMQKAYDYLVLEKTKKN